MRKIPPPPIIIFVILLLLVIGLGLITANWIGRLPLGEFRALAMAVGAVAATYLFAIAAYRLCMTLMPLQEGVISEGSSAEFRYYIHLLFHFFFFQPIIRSNIVPVPLMRTFYLALGARLGTNTYSPGPIFDSPLAEVGDNTIVGHDAIVLGHSVEGKKLILGRVRIGNNVTIGARAVLMPGVTVGDGSVVAIGAVVTKGTQIGPAELWAGNPAKLVRKLCSNSGLNAASPNQAEGPVA